MQRWQAREIAGIITNGELNLMFKNAMNSITDWTAQSKVNKSMSKGAAWNILASNFDINHEYHVLAKINMIIEYGEYLPIHLKPEKINKNKIEVKFHSEPDFRKFKGQ